MPGVVEKGWGSSGDENNKAFLGSSTLYRVNTSIIHKGRKTVTDQQNPLLKQEVHKFNMFSVANYYFPPGTREDSGRAGQWMGDMEGRQWKRQEEHLPGLKEQQPHLPPAV